MARLVTAIAVAMALVCPASAETFMISSSSRFDGSGELAPAKGTPSLVIGSPTSEVVVQSTALALRAGKPARLTLVLSTTSLYGIDAELSLWVPRDARITALAMTLGTGKRLVATAQPATDAHEAYERIRSSNDDPALLSFDRAVGEHDRLLLRAFPLTKGVRATVEIDVALPVGPLVVDSTQDIERLIVDTDGSRRITNLSRPFTVVVPATPDASVEHIAAAVDASTSLFVDGPHRRRAGVIVDLCCAAPRQVLSLTAQEIRREVKRHIEQLGHCYTHELQSHQNLAGSVVLRLMLVPDGTTQVISVAGDLDSEVVRACIADQAAQWRFHEHEDTIAVNYPLTFVKPSWL